MSDEIHSSGAPSQKREPHEKGVASLPFGPQQRGIEKSTAQQAVK